MLEIKTMIDRKYPNATKTRFWRENAFKVAAQHKQLQLLRNRRPEVYKDAVIGLVDWVGKRSAQQVEELRQARVRALEASELDEA